MPVSGVSCVIEFVEVGFLDGYDIPVFRFGCVEYVLLGVLQFVGVLLPYA